MSVKVLMKVPKYKKNHYPVLKTLENDAKRLCTEVGHCLPSFVMSSRATGPLPRQAHQRASNRAIRKGSGRSFIPPRYKHLKGELFYREYMDPVTGAEDTTMPIFMMERDQVTLAGLERVHLDCTFKVAKNTQYSQLMIIGGKVTNYYTDSASILRPKSIWQPLCFVLLANKKKETYSEAYRRVRGVFERKG